MIYGYARVSTKKQAKDGNSLEAQERALIEHGALPENIFKDSYTGTKKHRPALDKLMAVLKDGDTLIVTKLDRVARSAIQGLELIEELISRGVTINILAMGVLDNTPSGKLMRTMFLAFAEFERNMIVERTSEGREIARETKPNYKEGRKELNPPEFKNIYAQVQTGEITATEAAQKLGVSRRTFYNLIERCA